MAGKIKTSKYKLAANCVLFSLAHLAISDSLLAAIMLRVTSCCSCVPWLKGRKMSIWVQRSLVECYLESAPQYTCQRGEVAFRVNVDLGMEAKGFVEWGVVGLVFHGKLSYAQVCVQSWVISTSAEVVFSCSRSESCK